MLKRFTLRSLLLTIAALVCGLYQHDAFAHFLFIRIGEHAEGGRGVEVFFSEKAAAGDPRYIDKISGTFMSMQSEPGKFVPLKVRPGADRLRANLPSSGAVGVTGACQYGVLQREVAFLLRYYPKAIAGSPAEVNQLKPNHRLPAEILANVDGDTVTLTLLDKGVPVPNSAITIVDDALKVFELKTDDKGKTTFKPPIHSHYCCYAKVVRNESGDENGKYTEIRDFPTLAFQWPLGPSDSEAAAVDLFQSAIATRASWTNFPGFAANIAGDHDGRPYSGTVQIAKDGSVQLKIDQDVATAWVEEQLKSIVMHRQASSASSKPTIRFADEDTANPLGRLLLSVGNSMASSYRIRDGQILTVNRRFEKENVTITTLDTTKTVEGKFLPHLYNVQYWDGTTGDMLRTETVENHWERQGNFDLPTLISVITSSSTGVTVRTIRLSNFQLVNAN